jgi:methyl-accepting chemotaxis protein
MKIAYQLALLVAAFAFALILLTGLGLYGQSKAVQGLNTVYEDRVVPLHQLESIVENYAVRIVDASHKIRDGSLTWQQGRRQIREALAEIDAEWSAYLETFSVPEEERLVAEVEPLIAAADRMVDELQAILQRQDQAALEALIGDRLYPAINPVTEGLQALMDVQLDVAEARYLEATERYRVNRNLIIGTLILVLTTGPLLGWAMIARITRRLGAEPDQVAEIATRVADQDLSLAIETRANDHDSVMAVMKRMVAQLADVIADVRQSSEAIHVGAREIASGNADLSSRTEQQASALEETASSMEELTATVKQNADNARQASTLALEASTTAERGGDVVGQVVKTMHGISESSSQIADITNLIDSIAFQTNILALNASVEAARAGEQGRGFAVVAGEVRNLASRSAKAADDIKQLIDGAVNQISAGSTLAEQAGATMEEVVGAVRRVTDIMDEISAASQEQSDGIEQVSQAVGQMDQVTQQNAALVQQASSAAASLEEQADRLERAMARFRLSADAAATHSLPTQQREPAARPAALPASSNPKPSRPVAQQDQAPSDDDWEEF